MLFEGGMMNQLIKIISAIGIIALFSLSGLYLRKKIFKALHELAARTTWKGDDIIIKSLKGPFLLWCIVLGVQVALTIVSLPENIALVVEKILFSIIIISITIVVAKICVSFIKIYADKFGPDMPITGISRTIIYGLVISIGIMILLNTLGISITPLLIIPALIYCFLKSEKVYRPLSYQA